MRFFLFLSLLALAMVALPTVSAFPARTDRLSRRDVSMVQLNDAACSTNADCLSAYCQRGICTATVADGQQCDSNAACQSGLCSSHKRRCVPRTTEQLLQQAKALSTKEAQPLDHGVQAPFALLQQPGTKETSEGKLLTLGQVTINQTPAASSAGRSAVQLQVDGASPAVVAQKLTRSKLHTGAITSDELVFSYRVTQFVEPPMVAEGTTPTGASAPSCYLLPIYNGNALGMPIVLSATTDAYQTSRMLLAPHVRVHQVAFTVTCDLHTSATLLLSSVEVDHFTL